LKEEKTKVSERGAAWVSALGVSEKIDENGQGRETPSEKKKNNDEKEKAPAKILGLKCLSENPLNKRGNRH